MIQIVVRALLHIISRVVENPRRRFAISRQRIEPGPGQESVWDYPRPPRMEDSDKRIKVVFGEVTLVYTSRAKRVLETSHPPVYYIPPEDIQMEFLKPSDLTSHCEWKGRARYYDIATKDDITGEEKVEENAAWYYPDPAPGFESLKNYVAFYSSKMDNCWVGGEKVWAQERDFLEARSRPPSWAHSRALPEHRAGNT